MITSFKHSGVKAFFETGSKAGIKPDHASKLPRLLSALNAANAPKDMNRPGYGFHSLTGPMSGKYAVSVNGNWRLVFEFENGDAVLVDYMDYH